MRVRIFIERFLKVMFSTLFVLVAFFFLRAVATVIGDWTSVESYILIVLFMVLSYVLKNRVSVNIPAASVGIPESSVLGRFKPEEQNETFCSVPISKTKEEGFHFKWPHHQIIIENRGTYTLDIPLQNYDIQKGAVLLSGLVQWRLSFPCAYRRLAVSRADSEEGMSALIDEVIVEKLITSDLEQALKLKSGIKEAIEEVLNKQAEVDNPTGGKEPRTLYGKPVSVAANNFAAEITMVKIRDIKPIEQIAEGRSKILIEELEKDRTAIRMAKFQAISDKFKLMYPDMGVEQRAQLLKLTENLSKEERKVIAIGDLPEVEKMLTNLVPAVIMALRGGPR